MNSRDTYRIYDNDKLHPNAKKMVITILACVTFILFCLVLISRFTIISIIVFLFFTFILLKKVKAIKKKKMIVFGEEYMRISWTSLSKTVEETISVPQISKIKLGIYSRGRGDKYTIEVHTDINKIKFAITMAENMEIEEYFKRFCKFHEIEFDY